MPDNFQTQLAEAEDYVPMNTAEAHAAVCKCGHPWRQHNKPQCGTARAACDCCSCHAFRQPDDLKARVQARIDAEMASTTDSRFGGHNEAPLDEEPPIPAEPEGHY